MTGVADGLAAGSRSPVAKPLRAAEGGLRLLAAASGTGAFRWAPDPDAPALRELAPGEARLTIRSFRVGPAARRSTLAARLASGVPALGWTSIPATGLAEVTESLAHEAPVGSWWAGLVHVGTHLVFRTDLAREMGLVAAAALFTLEGHDAVGRDEVERLIATWRDGSAHSVESGAMTLTATASSPATGRPICVASWHRPQAAHRTRGLSTEPRPT